MKNFIKDVSRGYILVPLTIHLHKRSMMVLSCSGSLKRFANCQKKGAARLGIISVRHNFSEFSYPINVSLNYDSSVSAFSSFAANNYLKPSSYDDH